MDPYLKNLPAPKESQTNTPDSVAAISIHI